LELPWSYVFKRALFAALMLQLVTLTSRMHVILMSPFKLVKDYLWLGFCAIVLETGLENLIQLSLLVITFMSVSIFARGTIAGILIHSLDQSFKCALILDLILLFRPESLSSLRTELIMLQRVCVLRFFT